MKITKKLLLVLFALTTSHGAEWKILEPIRHMPGGQSRELQIAKQVVYSYESANFNQNPEKRLTLHSFYWKGEIVFRIKENELPEDEHYGNTNSINSEGPIDIEAIDFDRDGLVDLVIIGGVRDPQSLLYGRCTDGIFSLVPKNLPLEEIKKFLKKTTSEQAAVAYGDNPAN
jgi:hypothetical protein